MRRPRRACRGNLSEGSLSRRLARGKGPTASLHQMDVPAPHCCARSNLRFQVERGTAIRLHIIISDDLFDASGSLVEAMRVFQGHDPSPEQPPTTRSWSTRRSARAPTNPDCSPVRVALLELGVQPPVNLIVGERFVGKALACFRPILPHVNPPNDER